MIIGIGIDLIDIRSIEQTLDRFGDRFVERIFTEIERAKSERRAAR
ncbi:MAG: holo-ACP synthase, partial [Alphaproteobacteria bacterium]